MCNVCYNARETNLLDIKRDFVFQQKFIVIHQSFKGSTDL